MNQLDLSFAQDPNTLSLALLVGMTPAIIWFYFWRHEDNKHPRRGGLFTKTFIGGIFAVILVLPIQIWISNLSQDINVLNVLWAGSEELLKFFILLIFAVRSPYLDEPVDYAIYMMAVAVGFSGFENALYFLSPLQSGDTVGIALASTTRFIGSTLMHIVSSSVIGLVLGFAYFRGFIHKVLYGIFGLTIAIFLHSLFNHYIGSPDQFSFFQTTGMLWVVAVLCLFLFEILRSRGSDEYRKKQRLEMVGGLEKRFASILSSSEQNALSEQKIIDALKEKGKSTGTLVSYVDLLRKVYKAYLVSTGASNPDAKKTAEELITNNISPKAISGLLLVLKGEDEKSLVPHLVDQHTGTSV